MTDSSPTTVIDSTAPAPVALPKPGVFVPWLMVGFVLILSWILHIVMDPVSETIEKFNILKDLITQSFPQPTRGLVSEFLSWVMALGIQTPYGSLAWLITSGIFVLKVFLPLVASFLGALISHTLLFITGGTSQGWRFTWRAFAFNRIGVELVSIAVFIVVGYSPLQSATQILILLLLIPGIRLIAMGALLAQIIKGQQIGFLRSFVLAGPVFVLFTIISIILSLLSVFWVGLWCIARAN